MHWEEVLLLIASPLVGGAAALARWSRREEYYRLVLSFSGAFLFGVSVLYLFPIALANGFSGVYVLAGFVLQLILEQLTKGIEHGHFHAQKSVPFVASLLLGLTVHSFFDGVPVYAGESHNHNHSLLWAVALHKVPEGYALVAILFLSAIITPSPDMFSQVIVALPLYALYEASVLVSARVNRNRVAAAEAEEYVEEG